MNRPQNLLPPARVFLRSLIARSVVGLDEDSQHAYAVRRWGDFQAEAVTRAAIPALGVVDFGGVDPAKAFFGLARDQSVLGRMVGLRRIPFYVRVQAINTGARAYWVSQAKSKPLSRPDLAGGTNLAALTVASIIVLTKEAVESREDAAEEALQTDITGALAAVLDEAFLDPSNGGINGEVPAAITHGQTRIASTSDFGADLKAMFQAFHGDLSAAYFVTSPDVAVAIATMTDSDGHYVFAGIGPKGGELLGIPTLTTRASLTSSDGGVLTLIDASGIAAALGALEFDTSGEATLQMTDSPNDAGAPVFPVSMFQTNSIAWRASIAANRSVQRAGAVVSLTGL